MSSYNEDDQIVELKAWWEENGRSVMVGIFLAVLTVGGWTFWTRYQEAKAQEAATIYYQMIDAYEDLEKTMMPPSVGAKGADGKDKLVKLSAFQQTVTNLKSEYGSSEYANYARLLSAKYYVMEKDLNSAEKELREVLASNPPESLKFLTIQRLVRVLTANKKYDEALKLAEIEDAGSYKAAFAELKGDIYFQQGDGDKALAAYSEARSLMEKVPPQLDMKYYNLLKKAD